MILRWHPVLKWDGASNRPRSHFSKRFRALLNSIFIYLLPDQLWRLNSDNELENKRGTWKHHNEKWSIPSPGATGTIVEQSSTQLLAVLNDDITTGTVVDLEDTDKNLKRQQWYRSKKEYYDGWFTLKNCNSNTYLTAESVLGISITGMYRGFFSISYPNN